MRTAVLFSAIFAIVFAQTSQFSLQFTGFLVATDATQTNYHYSSKATSQTIATVITPQNGVYMNVTSSFGAAALLEADMHFDSFGPDLRHGKWSGAGNITFGVHGTLDHIIFFETVENSKGDWERTTTSSTQDGVGGYFDIIGGQGAYNGVNGFLSLVGTVNVPTLSFVGQITGVLYYANSTEISD